MGLLMVSGDMDSVGPPTQTRHSEAAWTMGINMTSRGEHQPWASTQLPAAKLTKGINMGSSGNTGHPHQHDFRQQHRQWTSTWP